MRRPAVLVLLLAALAALWRRRSSGATAEQDLWHEATSAPDLR